MTDVREERKVVTAVFADVVGSTALAERVDPEDVRHVVGEETTHRSVEGIFDWSEQRDLVLKGKRETVPAWIVAGIAAEARSQRGLPGVETRLVGRARELAAGREALEAVQAGRGGVLV